jgi:ABC-type sugar transport system substrate-binding protein
MKVKKVIPHKIFLILLLFLIPCSYLQAAKFRIDMFSPALSTDFFWNRMTLFSQAAAADLEIDLRMHYVDYDRQEMVEQLKTLLTSSEKTNGVIFQSLKKNGGQLIQLAEKHKTPAILFNAGLDDKSKRIFGFPREKYQYWIGELLPDDEDAGYQLALTLIAQAKLQRMFGPDQKIHLFGIMGAYAEGGSIERVRGFEKAIYNDPKVKYFQMVQGYWDQERAKRKALGLFKRYPSTQVVWAANDPMALGVIDAAQTVGKISGKDVLIGGIDWTDSAVQAVIESKLVTTVGGHFMDGAWSLVLFHDYLKGKDFNQHSVRFKSKMELLTQKNLAQYRLLFRTELWSKIDFKQFSRVYNSSQVKYDFSIEKVLAQLK